MAVVIMVVSAFLDLDEACAGPCFEPFSWLNVEFVDGMEKTSQPPCALID